MSLVKTSLIFLALVFSHAASASVAISFAEGAPKDRFVITNIGQCKLEKVVLKIDLSSTAGKLIFDTTALGAGVEVFQPFESADGSVNLKDATDVKDGQTSLELAIDTLLPNSSVSFTIDVDDTMTQSELGNIRVSGAEIQGGTVNISAQGVAAQNAAFGNDAKATIALEAC